MHIPSEMLNGRICPVTAAVSVAGVGIAAYMASKIKKKPTAARFGAVAALIFAAQMMNFPIQNGTSGHLLGGVLAAALLGTPFAVMVIALVVTLQCLIFSDGGFLVLGANVLNMALIGAGLGGFLRTLVLEGKFIKESSPLYAVGLGMVAWLSVVLAALAVSIELSVSGVVPFSKVAGAMLGTHALIGIGEGIITVAAFYAFGKVTNYSKEKWNTVMTFATALVIGAVLSPFASHLPDGLEWVAKKYQFLHEAAPTFVSPLSDYSFSLIQNNFISTALAGLLGVLVTFSLAWFVGKFFLFFKPAKSLS